MLAQIYDTVFIRDRGVHVSRSQNSGDLIDGLHDIFNWKLTIRIRRRGGKQKARSAGYVARETFLKKEVITSAHDTILPEFVGQNLALAVTLDDFVLFRVLEPRGDP